VRLIRRDLSYSINEIAELFALHPQAVRQWIKAGLETIDDHKPFLIHGNDLIAFLIERQSKRKHSCRAEQLYCFRCRGPRKPRNGRVTIQIRNATQLSLAGLCEICGLRMNRVGSVRRLADYRTTFNVETIAPARIEGDACVLDTHHLEGLGNHETVQSQK
jgi:hypothetical protein